MIVVTCKKTNNYITQITTVGHANYDEHGKDIVCSAVSAVFTGLMNEMSRYSKVKNRALAGDASLMIERPNKETQVLMEYALHTIKDIAREYPNNVMVVIE